MREGGGALGKSCLAVQIPATRSDMRAGERHLHVGGGGDLKMAKGGVLSTEPGDGNVTCIMLKCFKRFLMGAGCEILFEVFS